ncbi:MAG: transposase, partial [Desulfobacterales bacterium]|nr:transposase [Desulfobacterales bacterium]
MGKYKNDWQDAEYILGLFDKTKSKARRLYSSFVKIGIEDGRRPELAGGGLIRSLGSWSAVKALRGRADRIKGDERILGDGDVDSVLKVGQEQLERRYQYQSRGYDFDLGFPSRQQ